MQQRTSTQTSNFNDIFQQISTFYDASGARARELIIITNAVPSKNHRSQWAQAELTALREIKNEWFQGIKIRAIPINAPCTQYRSQRYAEDCAYFEALAVIDSYSSFESIQEPVLCRTGEIGCGKEIANYQTTFYSQFVTQLITDLSEMNGHDWCDAIPRPPPICSCTARAHIEVCMESAPPGPPGVKGPDNGVGLPGLPGLMSKCGPTGGPGYQGSDGRQGLPGIPGLPAQAPEVGSAGEPGDSGYSGLDGNNGIDGDEGEPGARGPQGVPGPNGRRGLSTNKGPSGFKGLQGRPGDHGDIGSEGAPGVDGPNKLNNELIPPLDELLADMDRRILDFIESDLGDKYLNNMAEQFVGTGNGGRSFCDCDNCEKKAQCGTCGAVKPTPPPQVCEDCKSSIAADMVVIHDVSG